MSKPNTSKIMFGRYGYYPNTGRIVPYVPVEDYILPDSCEHVSKRFYHLARIDIIDIHSYYVSLVVDLLSVQECKYLILQTNNTFAEERMIHTRKDHELNKMMFDKYVDKTGNNHMYVFGLLIKHDPVLRKRIFNECKHFNIHLRAYYVEHCTNEEFEYFMNTLYECENDELVRTLCEQRI